MKMFLEKTIQTIPLKNYVKQICTKNKIYIKNSQENKQTMKLIIINV